jgi:hypothetical protein
MRLSLLKEYNLHKPVVKVPHFFADNAADSTLKVKKFGRFSFKINFLILTCFYAKISATIIQQSLFNEISYSTREY